MQLYVLYALWLAMRLYRASGRCEERSQGDEEAALGRSKRLYSTEVTRVVVESGIGMLAAWVRGEAEEG
jgi:hypothetical protein